MRSLKIVMAAIPLLIGLLLSQSNSPEPESAARIVQLNNRAVALLDQFNFEEAIKELQQAVDIDPTVAPLHVNQGIAYFYDQQYDEAEAAFKRALEIDRSLLQARYMLGLIYRQVDKTDDAMRAFERVQSADPDDPSTNYFLGRLHMRTRNYQRAADFFRRVIEREPYNASAHYNLATTLNRSGNREAGRRQMAEFQRLQGLFGSSTIGQQYLEQGKYAAAIDKITSRFLPDFTPSRDSEINVRFENVAERAGLTFTHGGPGSADLMASSQAELEDAIVPYFGSGLAFVDIDRDGDLDLYFANSARGEARGRLYLNLGQGRFEDITQSSGIDFSGKSMYPLWGDFNQDAYPDLYLVNYGPNRLYENLQDGTFKDVTADTGTGDAGWGLAGAFVDYDHDGDLDLLVANFVDPSSSRETGRFPSDFSGSFNKLYRNNSNGTFADVTRESKLAERRMKTTGVIASDLDNSRDIDFYFLNQGEPNRLFTNLRDGSFRDQTADSGVGGAGSGIGVAAADYNRDGFIDLALPSLFPGNSGLFRNLGNLRFRSQSVFSGRAAFNQSSLYTSVFLDYDNDGDQDLLIVAGGPLSRGDSQRNFFLLSQQDGKFEDVSAATGLDQFSGLPLRGIAVADYDNDGDLDIAASVNGARPLLLRNEGGNQNNWIAIRPLGTNSNRLGVGAKIEIKAGRLWQKQEVYRGHGLLTHVPPYPHFGLGKRSRVDVVRLLWPNGVLQSEIDTQANQVLTVEELDRKGTSCPILYVWNGETYQFQTDFLGGSAYGYQLAPGVFNTPDTDEYIKLVREDISLDGMNLKLTMNNQLEEVIFYDYLKLLVVDHPDDYEVFPDEKLLPGPPYDGFRLHSAARAKPPAEAWNDREESVLEEVRQIDRRYPDLFKPLPYKGYAETHSLVLDLGQISADRAVLFMHAWIDYADSTSNLAASQAGLALVPPYLQVRDESGSWVTVIERMGFPAGLPKTMTVDLSGKFLSASRQVRIVTNMRIYWDQILVDGSPAREDYEIHTVKPAVARLGFKGFPRFYSPDGRLPKIYDYEDASTTALWKAHVGGYTRYGDVLPLLQAKDDRMIVTRSGDEVRVSFDLSSLPPLPDGWVRDYLLYVDGFGKDMDPNSGGPHFVGPFPFHGMPTFPYDEEEVMPPGDDEFFEYLKIWNTRTVEEAVPPLHGDSLVDHRNR